MTRPAYVLLDLEEGSLDEYDLDRRHHPMPEPFRWLAAAISDISEDCWCAGWLTGCEWTLLDVLDGMPAETPARPREWGMGTISDEQVANLRSIRGACAGGWVRWVEGDNAGVVALAPEEVEPARAEHWRAAEESRKRFEAYKARRGRRCPVSATPYESPWRRALRELQETAPRRSPSAQVQPPLRAETAPVADHPRGGGR